MLDWICLDRQDSFTGVCGFVRFRFSVRDLQFSVFGQCLYLLGPGGTGVMVDQPVGRYISGSGTGRDGREWCISGSGEAYTHGYDDWLGLGLGLGLAGMRMDHRTAMV